MKKRLCRRPEDSLVYPAIVLKRLTPAEDKRFLAEFGFQAMKCEGGLSVCVHALDLTRAIVTLGWKHFRVDLYESGTTWKITKRRSK